MDLWREPSGSCREVIKMKFMQITDEIGKLIALFPSECSSSTWQLILLDVDGLCKEYTVSEVTL
jgi:disulfide bond formation protein DsbB